MPKCSKKATRQVDIHYIPSDEDIPVASGNVAKKKYNEMARKANLWQATMIELRDYNIHLLPTSSFQMYH